MAIFGNILCTAKPNQRGSLLGRGSLTTRACRATPHAQRYFGHTADLRQRVADHNAGMCPHTSKFMPWKLNLYSPLHFWGCSSSANRSFDMREAKRAALFAPTIFRGHSSASQSGCFTCIMSKVRILLPSPFLSLWCSQVNMPAPHAGDHRSEAGQGRQFHRPQSIVSDAFAR